MVDMTAMVAEQLGDVAAEIQKAVQWWGTAFASIGTVHAMLSAGEPEAPTISEREAAFVFYHGIQWPQDVAAHRQAAHRPVLVVNMLPALVARAIDAQGAAGLPPASTDCIERLIVLVVRQNRDAQMLYNFTLSRFAELLAVDKMADGE